MHLLNAPPKQLYRALSHSVNASYVDRYYGEQYPIGYPNPLSSNSDPVGYPHCYVSDLLYLLQQAVGMIGGHQNSLVGMWLGEGS